jgi:hypothetical protein
MTMAHVALTLDGRYLQMGGGGPERRLDVGTDVLEPRGVFERCDLGHGRIALRTLDGRFLATCPDAGHSYGVYPVDELTPAAAFEEVLWPDGQVSLRSCHLTYVGEGPEGRVTVNRVAPGPFERFSLVAVPAPSVPEQRRRSDAAGQSSAPRATSASPSSSA